ncbi:7878_t:CDS:2 [Acaulospora morrowiae]|uniref:7878_t:CDS:1 n=1 Tax=Acaulospora morrowiae TaxID=94023 RepID=A0A9N9C0I6_9GLOM|nr:7878_t:CDS:2 [Acaulospora morrowiae]
MIFFIDSISGYFSTQYHNDYNINIKVGENTETQEFRAHTLILKARSPYFKRAISDSWATIKDGMILFNKPNISPTVFTLILKYIYSGILDLKEVSKLDVLDLLVASDELLLGELIIYIQDYFINQGHSWLKTTICNDPEPFFTSESFPSLNKDIFLELIKRNDLEIDEVDIWEHLITWGLHQTQEIEKMKLSDVMKFSEKNFTDLKKTLDPFIPYIRFHEISSKDFFNKVRPFQKILLEPLFEDVISFLMVGTEPEQKKLPARSGFFIAESKIITRKHANVILNWIERNNAQGATPKTNGHKFTLLYRGTRDGFSATSFRQKVNNQGPVIAVVKIKGSQAIIGGFNATGWNLNGSYSSLNNSNRHFIFSFKSINDKTGTIGRPGDNNAISNDSNYILNFGSGDLLLSNSKAGMCNQISYDKLILDTHCFIAEELEAFKITNFKKLYFF